MDIASSMLASGGASGIKPLSLEGKINRLSPQVHQWTVEGEVGSGKDQTAFYNILVDEADGTNDEITPTFDSSDKYTSAAATRYIADVLLPLRMMHFTGASGTLSASVLETARLKFKRFMPDGAEQIEQVLLSTFVGPDRFQPTVLSVPINGEVLDGYTYPIVEAKQGDPTASGYSLAFAFGASNDPRADVPATRAAIVRTPGA
jgi:hypothetical protein